MSGNKILALLLLLSLPLALASCRTQRGATADQEPADGSAAGDDDSQAGDSSDDDKPGA